MIDAKELRIGSRIRQIVKTDCGICYGDISCTEDFLEVLFAARDYENYDPIPLTPEILIKCGFIARSEYFVKVDSLLLQFDSTWWWTNAWEVESFYEFESLTKWQEIQHLHQLQNLYFALTGKELTVNHTTPSQLH